MDRVLQSQENALNAFQENMQPDRIAGIMLIFNGTADTGQTGAYSDLGEAVIKRGGTTLVNRPMDILADMGNIRAGSNLFSSAEAGTFTASVFIPFYALSLEQALNIQGTNELNFSWTPAGTASTVFTDLQVSVYTVVTQREEYYNYFILGDDATPSTANNSKPYQLNRRNITEIYLKDRSSVLNSAGLRQDGIQKYSEQPVNVIKAGTLYENMLEVNDFDTLLFETYTKGNVLSVQNEDTILELSTSGSGTVAVTHCSIQVTNQDFYG